MTPVAYSVPHERTSPHFARAFAQGCSGLLATMPTPLQPGPFAAFCTPAVWPLLRQTMADGCEWYYGDHAYFGRFRYYRITRNALQHDGRGEATPDRFVQFRRPVHPWRRSGSHVLVCPNSASYLDLFGLDVHSWVASVVHCLGDHTDREVRVRWKDTARPIAMDLVDAWAVVTFSSAAALDALIAGVPVFVLAPFAASARMGLSDLSQIESPVYPDDRESFFHVLADNQWTLAEIQAGMAWRHLQGEAGRRAA